MRRAANRAHRAARQRAADAPVWRQALVGVAWIAAGASVVVLLGIVLASVVAWLF